MFSGFFLKNITVMSVNKKHESSIIKYIIAEANNMLINNISVIQNKGENGLNYHKKVFF